MDDDVERPAAQQPEGQQSEPAPQPEAALPAVDLRVLEEVERELHAVEAALQQIDAGVYDGFEGLDAVDVPSPGRSASPDAAPSSRD